MSAFMMPAKTTAIIAEYLSNAAYATEHMGTVQGIKTIPAPRDLCRVMREEGCYDEKFGMYSADKIYKMLVKYNAASVSQRYEGRYETVSEPFSLQTIDIQEESRREWLANLYTVASCYIYQCDEGNVPDTEFFKAFSRWVNDMACELAEMVVREVRGIRSSKSWDEF